MANLTVSFTELKQEMRDGFQKIDQKFGKVDQKFDKIDQKFDRIDQKFEQLDQKIDTEISSLRQEMNQRFDQLVTLIQMIA